MSKSVLRRVEGWSEVAQGRCAGCGEEGLLRSLEAHVARCSSYAALFRSDPSRALSPAEEARRVAGERTAAPVRRARAPRPKVSEVPATVVPLRAVAPERIPGPVIVEYWQVPDFV